MAEEDSESNGLKKCKVIVIGGGVAGLSAANHLVKNHMLDFVLLESRKRIGGRIYAHEIGGYKFEMGANWIHGVLGNPMYEIAVAHGLVDIVQNLKPHKVIAVTEEGKQVPFHILQETYEAYMCFLHRCEEYFLCQYLPPEGIESVGEHIELEIELYLEKMKDSDERILRRRLFDCLLKRETCITGCHSMSEIDLLELGSYAELQGGNIALPSGYASILGPISKDIPTEKILLEHTVTEIRWKCDQNHNSSETGSDSDSDQTVIESECLENRRGSQLNPALSDSEHSVQVVCEDGKVFTADHVICTLPLGVLKERADSIFCPKLPENKRESIQKLLFGTVNKIFLAYERPFLHPEISEIMLVWNQDDTKGDVTDMSETWYKKIYSFSKVSDTILLGWVSGKEAEYMETLTEQEVADKCTYVLRKFLNDPYVPNPKVCVCTHWHGQSQTRGAYTAMAVGASQCDIETIAQPLYCDPEKKPVVLFAGEHTHSNFYSTVHGAYLSGRAAAQMVAAPEEPNAIIVDCPPQTSDLSSWIRGISLEDPS